MATARSVRVSVNDASGATTSAPTWLSRSQRALTDALAKAGRANPGRLNTAISRTNAQTTAGLVKFNQSTHTAATPFYITQWRNGQLIQVQPPAAGVTLDVPTTGLG
jgi:hypothetical protein